MAGQPRAFIMAAGGNAGGYHAADTTYTKIFVGGLAWETQRDTMRSYFEQFGEILEAVVITDKHTGRSKGYGFVTFKDPDAAMRACQDSSPVIDGRRANCNLASLGAANRPRPLAHHFGTGRTWPPAPAPAMASSSFRGSSLSSFSTAYNFHQPTHYALPYSVYGYSGGYSQESIYPMSYYGLTGGQQSQFSPYYQTSPGVYSSFYPYYSHYTQSSQTHGGFGLHYPQMLQYPFIPQQPGSASAIFSLPSSISATTAVATVGVVGGGMAAMAPSSSQRPGNSPEQRPVP